MFLLLGRPPSATLESVRSHLLRYFVRNDHVDWSRFDSDSYFEHNYRRLREDDREIIGYVGRFFADAFAADGPTDAAGRRGIDVGTGSNLYPSFGMLPFAGTVNLLELAPTSVEWLHRQRDSGFDQSWDPFWQAYAGVEAYKAYVNECDVSSEFRAKAKIDMGSVFDLPASQWDLGTMFFAACSLSGRHSEFQRAVRAFVGALKPGAPFAAAFMTHSRGYHVRDAWFPAVSLDEERIASELASVASGVEMSRIEDRDPLRPGVGMALATGFAK